MLLDSSSSEECDGSTQLMGYTTSKHIVATVLILLGSLCGSLLPILSKYSIRMRQIEFVYTLGKCVAIGVVLVVALVHMLQPANEALTHECAGQWFHTNGGPLAYALCAISFCAVYTTEFICSLPGQHSNALYARESESENDVTVNDDDNNSRSSHTSLLLSSTKHVRSRAAHDSNTHNDHHGHSHFTHITTVTNINDHHAPPPPHQHHQDHHSSNNNNNNNSGSNSNSSNTQVNDVVYAVSNEVELHAEHAKRVLSIIFFECGASIHSIFVGLAIGVCPDEELMTLSIAIVLHQFFEGIAIGASLVEAAFTLSLEAALALIFTFSAPCGAVIGMIAMSQHAMNTQGALYLRVQGILNAVCAGVLLYIGVSLLFVDFPRDMVKSMFTARRPRLRQIAMIVAVWIGMTIMVILGWYA